MKKTTESVSAYDNLQQMDTLELLQSINKEDQSIALAIEKVIPQIKTVTDKAYEVLSEGGRLFYIGAGTSGRLGVLDASELPPTYGVSHKMVIGLIAGGDGALRKSVENAEDNQEQAWRDLSKFEINSKDMLIGIAASGTTPYVIGGISKARDKQIATACITCNEGSPLAQVSEYPIEIVVGAEFVTGSTRMKAGTAQKLVLNMISTSVMIKMGYVKGNKMVNMQLSNDKLVNRGVQMLIEELIISTDDAKQLLLKHGSVSASIIEYNKKQDS